VSFDDFRADEEAETGARNSTDAVRAIASFEDPATICVRYTDPVIANRDRRGAVVGAYVDVDLSTVRRILDRVSDQILENSLYSAFIVIDHNRLRRGRIAKHVTASDRFHLILGGLHRPPQIGRPALQGDPTAFNRVQIGQLIHKRRRLQRSGLDALEHPRVVECTIATRGARGPENDGQRVLHVV